MELGIRDLKKSIGDCFWFYRRKAYLTQKEVGKKIGKSRAMVANCESGTYLPSWKTIFDFCKVVGVKKSTFYRRLQMNLRKLEKGDIIIRDKYE